MKRLLFILILPFVLASCNDDWAGTVIKFPTVIYVGDSLCVPSTEFPTAQQIVGIRSDCVWGITMHQRWGLPNPPVADLVFLALGSNDALLHLDVYYYGIELQEMLASTTATVYCVLPMASPRLDATPYRNKMLENCTNVLDPGDFGVNVYDGDMQHWDNVDHANFANGIISVLTIEGFIAAPVEEPPVTEPAP